MKVHDYHDGNRDLQERFGTTKLADRMAERAVDTLGANERNFIENANMFFLATCDDRGLPTCSYKGGDQGFVDPQVTRPKTNAGEEEGTRQKPRSRGAQRTYREGQKERQQWA